MSCGLPVLVVCSLQSEQKDLEHSKTFLEDDLAKVLSELERGNATVTQLKEKFDGIKTNTEKLTAVVKAGSGWTPDQKLRNKELEEIRDDLRAQLEGKQTTLNALRRDVDALQQHIDRGLWSTFHHWRRCGLPFASMVLVHRDIGAANVRLYCVRCDHVLLLVCQGRRSRRRRPLKWIR